MRAGQVLQTLLAECWSQLDQRLVRRLLGGLEAMIAGRQVVLMEMARQYPGATHAGAPLKALDQLLSNRRVQALRQKLYGTALSRFWSSSSRRARPCAREQQIVASGREICERRDGSGRSPPRRCYFLPSRSCMPPPLIRPQLAN